MIEMIRRQQAAQATVNRFRGQPLVYGKTDCVRMAVFVMRKMGHRPRLSKAGSYSTSLGAVRAMTRAGFASLEEAIDAVGLQRIPPAMALAADLILLPGEGPFGGALTVAVGNGRVLGHLDDVETAEILQPLAFVCAWRC